MNNNLQGINSRVDKSENQTTIWNIKKQTAIRIAKETRIFKKQDLKERKSQ